MKIKRFFAEDIRHAMRMVKDELGPDAVIMSNRSVDGGIEIIAARDFDEQAIHSSLQQPNGQVAQEASKRSMLPNFDSAKKRLHLLDNQRTPTAPSFNAEPPSVRRAPEPYVGYAEKMQQRKQEASAPIAKAASVIKEDPFKVKAATEKPTNVYDKLLLEMSQELKYLRTTMDTKLANISWAHNEKTTPIREELMQRLAGMNISKKMSVMIANRLANQSDPEQAFSKAQEMLAKLVPIADDSLLKFGGIVALVGPTGVGKTTTVAKLAAKFLMQHGPNQVVLITTDNYRIGAHEQLSTYGRLLNVPVRVASSANELRNLISSFSDKRLILIDTAGMSQRDMKLIEQINTLQHNGLAIKFYLVMAAGTEYKAMNAIIKAFSIFAPRASILTKLDEAVTVGSAISSLVEHNLPLSFIADGQQVPEDLRNPHGRSLVDHCVAEQRREGNMNENADYEPAWLARGYA